MMDVTWVVRSIKLHGGGNMRNFSQEIIRHNDPFPIALLKTSSKNEFDLLGSGLAHKTEQD